MARNRKYTAKCRGIFALFLEKRLGRAGLYHYLTYSYSGPGFAAH